MEPQTVKSHEKLTKRRLSTSNVIAINYILCNLIGAAVFLQAAQVHDANVPRLPLRVWESDYARLGPRVVTPICAVLRPVTGIKIG